MSFPKTRDGIREAARKLAVCYSAWTEARADKDDAAVICWGRMLLDAQCALQMVVPMAPELIESSIRRARERVAEAEEIEAAEAEFEQEAERQDRRAENNHERAWSDK